MRITSKREETMTPTITDPRWADGSINHRAREKARFKLYGFNEVSRMTSAEWGEECRRNNADFEEHPEEAAIREELAAAQAMGNLQT
jgi:hypothetical protein